MEYLFVAKKGSSQKPAAVAADSGLLEQRISPRHRVTLGVREGRDDGLRSAAPCIVDLSLKGAFLRGQPARLNAEMSLEFILPSRTVPIQARARVVRAVVTKASPTDPHVSQRDLNPGGVGVEFTHLSEADRQAIEEYLRHPPVPAPEATAAKPLDRQDEKMLFADTDIELFLTHSLSQPASCKLR